jgi:threonine dehydrogenase-like Zn-dependent dehydrogenase
MCAAPQGGQLADGTISMGAGLADLVSVPARQAFAVGSAPITHAAMGEPLACVVHSVRLSGLVGGDRVAVIGGGYMGRLHASLARLRGASTIGVIDPVHDRLVDANAAGVGWTSMPDAALDTGGRQDIVFVTAGVPGALELALQMTDDTGTIVLYGAFPKEMTVPVPPDSLHHHEISIIGVVNQEPQDWRTAAGLIASGALGADLDALVTARFSLASVQEAMELAARQPVYRVLVGDAP